MSTELSRASAARLSQYLRRLEDCRRAGEGTVSSGQLAEALDVSDAQVRRDLGSLGASGHPGIGYRVDDLTTAVRRTLGLDREWRAALVGTGNLGRALLRYDGFRHQGFRIAALFDNDPTKLGQVIGGLAVRSLDELPTVIPAERIELGVLTVPADAAQGVANQLCAAGVRGLLNFAPVVLRLPSRVRLVTVDLTVQLEQLAFLVQWADA